MTASETITTAEFASTDPCTGKVVWRGPAASAEQVAGAVAAARRAQPAWADQPIDRRKKVLQAFAQSARNSAELLEAVIRETGKPRWEAKTEVESVAGKVTISIDMHDRRQAETPESLGKTASGSAIVGRVRYRPLGVIAVIGPFNFPAHLPNGHITPALLAGNAVVFKPSEQAPLVAEVTSQLWQSAGLPIDVLAVLQGSREVATALITQPIDAVCFTGSVTAGRAIHRTLADRPEVLCALEMGGNNPLVVHKPADIDAAAEMIVASAYLTAGQRCSCARRLIVVNDAHTPALIENLIARIRAVRIGSPDDQPEPFIGPVISEVAADRLLAAQQLLLAAGGKSIVEMRQAGPRRNFLSPGLIDMTNASDTADEEQFGPLLTMIRVPDFAAAIAQANRTQFGLTAGLISADVSLREPFLRQVRAGVIHFNRPLTGASSKLPFGGIGASGNHRPSAAFAADYCADPIAVVES
jgi:succinylglutamic semialdehyde dehydrogenase